MPNQKIAILGATSHIAKGLIYNFDKEKRHNLFLFARNLKKLRNFLKQINCKSSSKINTFEKFANYNYDVIINCVGLGTPKKVKKANGNIFKLTEKFDNIILNYLTNDNNKTLYINISSGAVYGTDFTKPVNYSTFSKWNVNNIKESEYYGITKLYSEAKHRSLEHLNIVDLRVFSYFSRFIELDSGYLLTDIIACIRNKKKIITSNENITRDFVHPKDLFELIRKCMNKKNINDAFDVYSKKVITKFEILNFFKKNYNLEYEIDNNINVYSITGKKSEYYSRSKKAQKLGYLPKFVSVESIITESKEILNK
ncbi:MAG: hypothetical protein A2539_01150 [Elusimicrobia bacterium RIFOXYD2_FULL_34_15]|nr:MAG: hypothetical protein A2539_01150 [Elusimicrobia bacterium RIFOXYD2_FULL_34_15]